jgi:hypothetical protein
MEIKMIIMKDKVYACDFTLGQCGIFSVEQLQRLLLRAGYYESL